MTALQWIVKEAKKLKKEYPKRFKTWREYVAQASAIYASKHKGKSPVGKKHAVKKKAAKKKAVKKVARKKVSRKKVGAVSKRATTMHKDTKSHNVNIKVMSGLGKVGNKLFNSLSDLKSFHKEKGGHWFDRQTMKYFNTKIDSSLIGGKYFIYSNKMPLQDRYYAIAEAQSSGNIFPVLDAPHFKDKTKAKEYLLKHILRH